MPQKIIEEAKKPVIQELVNRADRRGFVTFEDVLEILEEDGDDVNTLESVLDELDELGIELRQEEAHDEVEDSEEEFESDNEDAIQDPGIGDINAVSADDPVGLYFRQMAQEPLLTAQEEVDLAKRIELGKEAYDKLHLM